MGKGYHLPLFRFLSQKPTSKRKFSKCVSGDYSCFDCYCKWTVQEVRTLCPVRALRYYLDRTKDLRGSRTPPFSSFKRTHLRHQTRYTLFLVKITILLCFKQADHQPWTWSKLKLMTLGPSRPLRPYTVGFWWTKSCKPVTGKLTHPIQPSLGSLNPRV